MLLHVSVVGHFATTVEAVRRHMVTQVGFTGDRIDRKGLGLQSVMRTTHATSRRCFTALLNCHGYLLKKYNSIISGSPFFKDGKYIKWVSFSLRIFHYFIHAIILSWRTVFLTVFGRVRHRQQKFILHQFGYM